MGLKEVASKLKAIEKKRGIPERERHIKAVKEVISFIEREDPAFMRAILWPLIELELDEVRAMGSGEKDLSNFDEGRFKMTAQEFLRGIKEGANEPCPLRWYDGQ